MRYHFVLFLGRKLLEVVASLLTLAILTFILLKALPGGPFDEEVALNPIVQQSLNEHWGVHESWYRQATQYLASLSKFDLGVSMVRPDRKVSEIIQAGISNTLRLNFFALLFIVTGAFAISIISVRHQEGWISKSLEAFTVWCLSLPSLFWGPLLIYVFGFWLDWLPVALLQSPLHYILPLLTLSLRPMASLVRLLKNSMLESYQQDYVRTARAKGLSEWVIVSRHVVRNSMIPFLSYLGPLSVSLLSGSFLVEVLFAVPGLGSEFVSSLNDRDYPLIVGLTLFYGFLLVLVNLGIDLLLQWVDPRLREAA